MSIYSDIEVADCALAVESILGIDMGLEEMFSDDLNQYFDYQIKDGSIVFYFEVNEGSCELVWDYDEFEVSSWNKTLEAHINNLRQ